MERLHFVVWVKVPRQRPHCSVEWKQRVAERGRRSRSGHLYFVWCAFQGRWRSRLVIILFLLPAGSNTYRECSEYNSDVNTETYSAQNWEWHAEILFAQSAYFCIATGKHVLLPYRWFPTDVNHVVAQDGHWDVMRRRLTHWLKYWFFSRSGVMKCLLGGWVNCKQISEWVSRV